MVRHLFGLIYEVQNAVKVEFRTLCSCKLVKFIKKRTISLAREDSNKFQHILDVYVCLLTFIIKNDVL